MLDKSNIVFMNTKANNIVSYWMGCEICKAKLMPSQQFDLDLDSDDGRELLKAVANYHTNTTTHDKFIMNNAIRTFECCICYDSATTENEFDKKVSWVEQHLANTGHKFFRFNTI